MNDTTTAELPLADLMRAVSRTGERVLLTLLQNSDANGYATAPGTTLAKTAGTSYMNYRRGLVRLVQAGVVVLEGRKPRVLVKLDEQSEVAEVPTASVGGLLALRSWGGSRKTEVAVDATPTLIQSPQTEVQVGQPSTAKSSNSRWRRAHEAATTTTLDQSDTLDISTRNASEISAGITKEGKSSKRTSKGHGDKTLKEGGQEQAISVTKSRTSKNRIKFGTNPALVRARVKNTDQDHFFSLRGSLRLPRRKEEIRIPAGQPESSTAGGPNPPANPPEPAEGKSSKRPTWKDATGAEGEHLIQVAQAALDAAEATLEGRPKGNPELPGDWRYADVPVYPNADVVPFTRLPGPPLLDPELPDRERFAVLARAWIGLADTRDLKSTRWALQTPYKLYRQGKFSALKGNRHFQRLVTCAAALLEHGVPPVAWVAFSFDAWEDMKKEGSAQGPPSVIWVFSSKRVEEHAKWCLSAASYRYAGGEWALSAPHQELIWRHDAMRADLTALGPKPAAADIKRIVENWFPESMYENLVREARKAAGTARRYIEDKLRDGEWLWRW